LFGAAVVTLWVLTAETSCDLHFFRRFGRVSQEMVVLSSGGGELRMSYDKIDDAGDGGKLNEPWTSWWERTAVVGKRPRVPTRFVARTSNMDSGGPRLVPGVGWVGDRWFSFLAVMPLWAVAAAFAGPPTISAAIRFARRRYRRRKGFCERCGYDFRATPGQCPECGAAVPGHAGIENETFTVLR
jgi:hypothetical protein